MDSIKAAEQGETPPAHKSLLDADQTKTLIPDTEKPKYSGSIDNNSEQMVNTRPVLSMNFRDVPTIFYLPLCSRPAFPGAAFPVHGQEAGA